MRNLTPMQAAYWVGRQSGDTLGGVAAHLYAEFDASGLNIDFIAKSVLILFQMHPMLRMRITPDGQQVIDPLGKCHRLSIEDMKSCTAADIENNLRKKRYAKSHQKLALESGYPSEFHLSLLPENRQRLHVDLDMIAIDPSCFSLIMDDLAEIYENPETTPQERSEYFVYLDQFTGDEEREKAVREGKLWWQNQLGRIPPAPNLPYKNSDEDRVKSDRYSTLLDMKVQKALKSVAKQHRVTLTTLMLALFSGVMGRAAGAHQFRLNVPSFHRRGLTDALTKCVGDFSDLLILSVDLNSSETLAEFSARIGDEMAEILSHSAYTGVNVMRDLSRHHGNMQLSPVVFTSGFGLPEKVLLSDRVTRVFGEMVWVISQAPQVALDVQVAPVSDGILVNWDVRLDVLPKDWVDELFENYIQVLHQIADAPNAMLQEVGAFFKLPEQTGSAGGKIKAEASKNTTALLQCILHRIVPETDAMLISEIGETLQENLVDFTNKYIPTADLNLEDILTHKTPERLAALIYQRSGGASEPIAQALLSALEPQAEKHHKAQPA